MKQDPGSFAEADEVSLVARARSGDLGAFDEIVRRHQQHIAACLHHFCRDHMELEDLVQDTFIRAFDKLDRWEPTAPLLSWIRRIGYNLGYDHLRKQKRNPLWKKKTRQQQETDMQEPEIVDTSRSSVEKMSDEDLVFWLLGQLKPDEAMIVTLQYLDQLSLQEIADRTGWNISRIKVKSHRTRNKLKHLLNTHETVSMQYSFVL